MQWRTSSIVKCWTIKRKEGQKAPIGIFARPCISRLERLDRNPSVQPRPLRTHTNRSSRSCWVRSKLVAGRQAVQIGWGLVCSAQKYATNSDDCFDLGLIISRGERHVLFSLCKAGVSNWSPEQVQTCSLGSEKRTASLDVTGMLLYKGGSFLQAKGMKRSFEICTPPLLDDRRPASHAHY